MLPAVLVVFSLMLSDFFDTMGTIIGVGGKAGFLDRAGRLPRARSVLLVDSVGARDYAVMQALVLLVSVTVVVANLLVDLVYGFLDPRIRLVRRGN